MYLFLYTQSIKELIDSSDIIFECSGDVVHAYRGISEIAKTDKKVITFLSKIYLKNFILRLWVKEHLNGNVLIFVKKLWCCKS